jgi:16S rRNA (cytidine1402-2'-O)-methyltransferase
MKNIGKLYIVATPIGNLGDITLRALEILKSVDFILCEDTRVTGKLLAHFEIKTPTISYHQHSKSNKVDWIISLLEEGKNLALVTDAGTPGISDPGNELINQLTNKLVNDFRIIPVPGPSAAIAATSVSGFPTDKFLFLGFPPHKNKRQKFFKEVAGSEHTVCFYESNHRIAKCLKELSEVLNKGAKLCVCRELTKQFESIYRGTISEILEIKIPEKGEFVIVISNS